MKGMLTAVGIAALTAISGAAQAQDYPTRPIRLISSYTPGGGNDIAARIIADALSPRLGQQVVVENRPGAAGLVGSDYVAKSPPDGYTLLFASLDTMTMVPALKKDMPYKVEDLTYIAKVSHNGMTIALHPSVPVKNWEEFVAYAKANPSKIRYGTNGIGGAPHLTGELLMQATGMKMTHVAYKGVSQAMTDLVGGHIEMAPLTPVAIAPYLNTDKVRIVGYTAPERYPGLPDTPTLKELGLPQGVVTVWYSVVGPPGLPAPIAERLRKEVAAALQDPVVKEKLGKLGSTIAPVFGDDFKKMVATELQQWKDLARTANITFQD